MQYALFRLNAVHGRDVTRAASFQRRKRVFFFVFFFTNVIPFRRIRVRIRMYLFRTRTPALYYDIIALSKHVLHVERVRETSFDPRKLIWP